MAEVQDDNEGGRGEEDTLCAICSSVPCEWLEFGKPSLEHFLNRYTVSDEGERVDDDGIPVPNTKIRKAVFKMFTYNKYGHLGQGNRIPIPQCVMDKVREAFPESDCSYLGFHDE